MLSLYNQSSYLLLTHLKSSYLSHDYPKTTEEVPPLIVGSDQPLVELDPPVVGLWLFTPTICAIKLATSASFSSYCLRSCASSSSTVLLKVLFFYFLFFIKFNYPLNFLHISLSKKKNIYIYIYIYIFRTGFCSFLPKLP